MTEKPKGKLGVCIDLQHLNKALERSHYPLPVIKDILPELADIKVFSKADVKDGFLQIQLDQETNKITMFQTPLGPVQISANALRNLSCSRMFSAEVRPKS